MLIGRPGRDICGFTPQSKDNDDDFDLNKPMFALERIALLDLSFDKIARGKMPRLLIDFWFFGSLKHVELSTSVFSLFTKPFKSLLGGVSGFSRVFKLPGCITDADCAAVHNELCDCTEEDAARGVCECEGECSWFRCTYS